MLKAVVRNGEIVPLEPLPADWGDGTELSVEATLETNVDPDEPDRWFAEMEAAVAQIRPEDAVSLEAALREADELAKAQMRREMGLP